MSIDALIPAPAAASIAASMTAPAGRTEGPDAMAAERAREFEALILTQFLKPMFAGLERSALFGGGGAGEGVYQEMLQSTFADAIAARGGIGVADAITASLLELQSDAQPGGDQS